MLTISNLSKTFRNKKVLNNISLQVAQGEVALLLGASGVGKSTLLRILNNLEHADAGTIVFNGAQLDLNSINHAHIFGMVFQQFNLFENMTVLENVTFPLEKSMGLNKKTAHTEALMLLKEYGLQDQACMHATSLSGGQKQRLAIVRSLTVKPRIMCMDEPTSALDPLLTNYVAQSIQKLAEKGYSVIVASHNIHLIDRLSCTIYLMRDGQIIESVDSHIFQKRPQDYSHIYNFVNGRS